jgi:cell division protein FtsN
MLRTEARLSIIGILAVFTATIVMFIEVANFGTAQGQAADNTSSSSSSLTPEQRAAICDPNNPSSNLNPVNTTESRICGIPKTVQPSISNGTDTGTEAPSVLPTPPSEEG